MAAVVPLLSHFPVSEHDSSSRSVTVYLSFADLSVARSTLRGLLHPSTEFCEMSGHDRASCDAVRHQQKDRQCRIATCSGEEVEKEACFTLGLLAIKQEHQHAIADQVGRSTHDLLVLLNPATHRL